MKIDITPTWAALMPAMLHVLQQQNLPDETRHAIRDELMRLARAVDKTNTLTTSDVHIPYDSPSKKSLFTELMKHPEPKSLNAALNSLLKPRLKKLIKELRINPDKTNELCNKFEDIRKHKSPTQQLFTTLRNATRCRRKH